MSLRIVHVVRQYAPSVGGLEAVVARVAQEQCSRLGHEVRVVTLDRLFAEPKRRLPARETIDGVSVVRLAWRGSSRYPLCPQVIGALGDADLVHVHAIDFFFDYLAATRWIHRKPLIATTMGGFFHTEFAATAKRIWFHTITRASSLAYRRLLAISDNDGAIFRRIAGDRVTVIEMGADLERYHDAAAPERKRALIYFGRWSSNKGLFRLLDLVRSLRRLDPRWSLIIAGRPYDISRADLTARIAALDLNDAAELQESPSDAELRASMTRSSYFACLSRHEGFGIAAIEAMSAGLVPILSDIPPFRKILTESQCGLLIEAKGSLEAQAASIEKQHKESATEPAAVRARAMTFAGRYDWSLVVDRYEAQYRAALAPHRGVEAPFLRTGS